MNVSIIKYNAGNIQSVLFALERLGVPATVTDNAEEIKASSHVIFPGVGAANSAMPYLQQRGLDHLIRQLTQPFLGICLGMQLMCTHSEEGNTACLGIFDLAVKKFPDEVDGLPLTVPHMGWNNLTQKKGPLMENLPDEMYAYFVHSYYAESSPKAIANTHYGLDFSSALQHRNFYGVQFHTEKSADGGAQILKNFLALTS
ncbi:MAG: imidazole glycerol phosphate synthase subunit HisH [Bacteroidetes bacterium]|nr:MAG: imidazole glycerol phosphate synthase subunit HisH [Bacteroidota bacterium]